LCRRGQASETDVFREEIGMLPEPVAGAFDLDDHSVVKKAIQQGGGDYLIPEDFAPFREATI
jgi:hypothetical protein